MCAAHFCLMKITEDVRKYAAERTVGRGSAASRNATKVEGVCGSPHRDLPENLTLTNR